MKAIGFANLAPDEVHALLKKQGITDIKIVANETAAAEHLIVLGVTNFFKFHKDESKSYYVVDSPLALMSVNIPKADCYEEENLHIDGLAITKNINLAQLKDTPEVTYRNYNIVERSTKIAKAQLTFLNQFMTFIYSLPAESHQTPVKKLVCKWMSTTESFGVLQRKLEALRKTISMNEKQVARLYAILSSDVTVKYRYALQQPGDEDEVAKVLKVSAYELRYIRAINRGKDK